MAEGDRAGVPKPDLTLIVDGANVVGSRPDGWWRDRAGAAVRLYDELAGLAERGAAGIPAAQLATGEDGEAPADPGQGGTGQAAQQDGPQTVAVVLVLEGAAKAAAARIAARTAGASRDRAGDLGTVQVVSAPGSGDDEIVRLARSRPGQRIVVTSDRELRRRSVAAGARVAGPSWLRAQL
ncbi:MAG: hypothetical protein ACLPKE_11890 [Streptosporangiaceae bacterium]